MGTTRHSTGRAPTPRPASPGTRTWSISLAARRPTRSAMGAGTDELHEPGRRHLVLPRARRRRRRQLGSAPPLHAAASTPPSPAPSAAWPARRTRCRRTGMRTTRPPSRWSAASDAAPSSVVAGYSYVLDQAADTTPDNSVEATGTSYTSGARADGIWYFHVRAVDTPATPAPPATTRCTSTPRRRRRSAA